MSTTSNSSPTRRNWACRRLTVTSSRKMSLSRWRPAVVGAWPSKNRAPALGPQQCRAMRRALHTKKLAHGTGGGRSVLFVAEVGTKRGGSLPGDVLRSLVIVVIGHSLVPSRLLCGHQPRTVHFSADTSTEMQDRSVSHE